MASSPTSPMSTPSVTHLMASQTTGPSHSHLNLTYNEVNEDVREGLLRVMNHSRVSVTTVQHYNTQLGADDQSGVHLHEEEEEEVVVWEVRTPSPSPPAAMLVFRPADVTSHVLSHNDVEERGPPVPSGYRESQIELSLNLNKLSLFEIEKNLLVLTVPVSEWSFSDSADWQLKCKHWADHSFPCRTPLHHTLASIQVFFHDAISKCVHLIHLKCMLSYLIENNTFTPVV